MRHLLTSLAHRALLQAKAREKLDRRRRNTDDDEDEGCITTRTEATGPKWAQETDRRNKQTVQTSKASARPADSDATVRGDIKDAFESNSECIEHVLQ